MTINEAALRLFSRMANALNMQLKPWLIDSMCMAYNICVYSGMFVGNQVIGWRPCMQLRG